MEHRQTWPGCDRNRRNWGSGSGTDGTLTDRSGGGTGLTGPGTGTDMTSGWDGDRRKWDRHTGRSGTGTDATVGETVTDGMGMGQIGMDVGPE